MSLPLHRLSTRARIGLALAVLALWIFARHQLTYMDGRFFQTSMPGVSGLAAYLLSDYDYAADAYWRHFDQLGWAGTDTDDSAFQALLRKDLSTAQELSRQRLAAEEGDPSDLLTLGHASLLAGEYPQTLDVLSRIPEREPEHIDALLLSSIAHQRLGNVGEAIDSVNRALRTNGLEARITTFLEVLRETGALTALPEESRPDCLLAHYYRYLRIYDPSNGRIAIRHAESAIAKNEHPGQAYVTIGIVYAKQGSRERALEAFLKAMETAPSYAMAPYWASLMYGKRGDVANEYLMSKAAYEADPSDPVYATHFVNVLEQKLGELPQAINVLQTALQHDPSNLEALDRLGLLFGQQGEYQRSAELYRRAIALEPKNPRLYEQMGWALARLRETEDAIVAFERAASINPRRPRPHLLLADVHYQRRQYREAIREFEQAFALGERDPGERSTLCMAYHMVSDFSRAFRCFKTVLEEDPDQPRALRMLRESQSNLMLQQAGP